MITLYSGPVSWFSRKVEIALHEKGLPFQQILVPFSQTKGYYDRPVEVVRINPKRQVPVMIDGAVGLCDSTVIIEYLEDAYPTPSLLPRSPADRARCRSLDVFADEVMLEPVRSFMHRTEPHDRASPRWLELERGALAALPRIAEHFDRLDDELKRTEHLCGEFSVADIACFMATFWANRLGGPGFGKRQNLRRWYRMLTARASFAKASAEILAQDTALSAPVKNAFEDC